MELHLQSHHWQARVPDWAAAAVAGFGAGGVLMLLELAWSAFIAGGDPWLTSRLIAAMAMSGEVLQTSGYSLTVLVVALLVHYALGVVFGVLLAAIMAPFNLDSSSAMALTAGALFGLLLYVLNFYGMTGVYVWFVELRSWPTAIAHVIFGMAAAFIYLKLERPARPR
ncbi:hypothetical protein [Duganella aceris]|jgi:hypothetical protein|uniref:Sodium:proline symporter n=1 Tax=Duganella aceris TaxID=2703883 RepID=A0ABX0FND0_9BURK|nr:hypothetical protein [Duganella aceris]NGZ86103.1 hypothetical protein [Duganella aceris]